jgi:DUF4097 and DUF4098 domain-containing protein YvlB
MGKATKIALTVAGACVVAGALVAGGALAALGFDFRALSTTQLQERTYEVQEPFQSIDISVPESDVRLLPAADGRCRVVCAQGEQITDTVAVENDTLTITRQDARKWYQRMGISWVDAPAVTVYLPETEYRSLTVQTVSGELQAPEDFTFATAKVKSTSGDLTLRSKVTDGVTAKSVSGDITLDSVSGQVQVTTTSGDVEVGRSAARTLTVTTTSGEIDLEDVSVEQGARITCVSGDVELERFDAETIQIKTVSGDVAGSLRSPKNFVIQTTSGRVQTPPSDPAAGECAVTTTSGDIHLELAD